MREVIYNKKFVKSYKRISRSGNFDKSELEMIVDILARNIEIPVKYHDHVLNGDFLGTRELHLRSDLLVIYRIEDDDSQVIFVDIGNHANLFGM
jgi:mRNA interferase YafQ